MLEFMLKNHLRFISVICVFMAVIHIKNTFFSVKLSPLPNIMSAQIQPNLSSVPTTNSISNETRPGFSNPKPIKNDNKMDQTDLQMKSPLPNKTSANQKLDPMDSKRIQILKPQDSQVPIDSTKNSFTKTYKKFAFLQFNKGTRTEYELDLNQIPKNNVLSLGFTVDEGSLVKPEVFVTYTDGSSEILKLPFSEMFQDDWVRLDTNPKLEIDSLKVSAASPTEKSIFSFFIQENL